MEAQYADGEAGGGVGCHTGGFGTDILVTVVGRQATVDGKPVWLLPAVDVYLFVTHTGHVGT